jgi:hypothetical protein
MRTPNVTPAFSRGLCGIAAMLMDRMLGWTAPDGIDVPE